MVKKQFRSMKVQGLSGYKYKETPTIMLKGQWLKEAGFEVMDHIGISYVADEKVAAIFTKYGNDIMSEVLADDITADALCGYEKPWNINGESVTLAVIKK